MKRMACIMLTLVLLSAIFPAQAAGVSEVMRVINCHEWVSLRAEPSTSSKRLAKVYLGELVTNCSESFDGFIECSFDGKTGYILSQYLGRTDYSGEDLIMPNQMVINVVEYISMHDSPSSSGRILTRVPVGAVVTSCVRYSTNFVYCTYQGISGYIASAYLRRANYSVTKQDASVLKKYQGLYPDISGPMEVVNCNEWVSLREKASASSARVARVPLGTLVTDCLQVSDTFVYCSYLGVWGYIQKAYLSETIAPHTQDGGDSLFDLLSERPSYDDFNTVGSLVEEFWSDPLHTYRLVIREDTQNGNESVCAAVFDSEIEYLCRMSMTDYDVSELSSICGFGGGTEEEKVLLWYSGGDLAAYAIGPDMYDHMLWTLPISNLGSGVSHAVDQDGTIYLIGYYQNILTCVSPDGKLLWQNTGGSDDVYWPYRIELENGVVNVIYEESGTHDGTETVVSFSKADGSLASSVPAPDLEPAVRVSWSSPQDDPYYLFTGSSDSEAVGVLFSPTEKLNNFELLSIELSDISGDSENYTAEILFTQPELTPEKKLLAQLLFVGDIPNNGFAYVDASGRRRVFALGISGENGDLIFWEINK